jgi:hypothetical protein
MKIYYFHDGTNQSGPFDIEELKQKGITKETPVWYEGLKEWTTAGEIKDLSTLFLNTPPPLKSAPPVYSQAVSSTVISSAPKNRKPMLYIGIAIAAGIAIFFGIKNNESAAANSLLLDTSAEFAAVTNKLAEIEQKEQQELAQKEALENKNREYRNEWEKYITFTNSEPEISYLLGGVSEFQITVGNQTPYILDQVDISVAYIRKNGDIYKTETVSIANVNPNTFETAVAPSSINGVKINVAIAKVVCKKMNFCYPSFSGKESDPYYCK